MQPQNQYKVNFSVQNNYLKNIRDDLLEEETVSVDKSNNDIVYINALINNIQCTVMIDTGANISLINSMELDRIQQGINKTIPTLPINNITLVGATGRQIKNIRKQVMLEVSNNGYALSMIFLVVQNLPFNILIGCNILRQYAAIINLSRGMVTLTSDNIVWSAEIIGSQRAPQNGTSYFVREEINEISDLQYSENEHHDVNEDLWQQKVQEIYKFQHEKTSLKVSTEQANMLVNIYNKYRRVFFR